jgi:hypothetical protein
MNFRLFAAISAVMFATLSGCNNAKSPDTVANNVAAAQQAANKEVANARVEAAKDEALAADKANAGNHDLKNAEATGAYDVAMAKAEGAHKVALENCNSLSGDSQSKCRDVADADYAAAKANSKLTEVSAKR